MKRPTQCGLLLVVLGCAVASVRADAVGDYKVILDRNPFNLKAPPPPPQAPVTAPTETPTDYKLSGITALFNPPRAMFVNEAIPGKPEYLSLSEGQRQGNLEVLPGGIDVKAGIVLVKISGKEQPMSFEKNGLKAPVGPPVMTAPGVPMPRPGIAPVPFMPTPGGTLPPPNLVPVTYNNGLTPNPAMAATGAIPPPGVGTAYPSRTPRSGTGAVAIPIANGGNQTSPPPAPKVDPAEQALRIEIQRKLTEVQVQRGELPPLPGTDLSPLLQPPAPPR